MKSFLILMTVLVSSISVPTTLANTLGDVFFPMPSSQWLPKVSSGSAILFPSVPEIKQIKNTHHDFEFIPSVQSLHISWDDLLEVQEYPIPGFLERFIQQWKALDSTSLFPTTSITLPSYSKPIEFFLSIDGITILESELPSLGIKKTELAILIKTDIDFHSARLIKTTQGWLIESSEVSILEDMVLNLYSQLARIIIIEPYSLNTFILKKNGEIIYINLKTLKKLINLWLQKVREISFFKFLLSIGLEESYPNVVPVSSGSTKKRKRPTSSQPIGQPEIKREKLLRAVKKEQLEADSMTTPAPAVVVAAPPKKQIRKNRLVENKHEREKLKEAILKIVKKQGIYKADFLKFDGKICESISCVMANAFVEWGNTIVGLNPLGVTPALETGQSLAEAIRAVQPLQSQYLARMFRYLQVMELPEGHAEIPLLERYKKGILHLLQYIALDQGGWLLSVDLLNSWLNFEDVRWISLFPDFPDLTEWQSIEASSLELPKILEDSGFALAAELSRYIYIISESTPSSEPKTASVLASNEPAPDTPKPIFSSYQPEKEHCFGISLFFVMTLMADNNEMRPELLSWVKAIDIVFNTQTDFFEYAIADWEYKLMHTIPFRPQEKERVEEIGKSEALQ